MKQYNFKIEHLYENENINTQTGCLCLYVNGHGRKTRFHEHEFYEFFVVLNDLTHYINGNYENLKRGDVVFIKPTDVHGIIYDTTKECDIINFSFSKKIMQMLMEYLDISKAVIDNLEKNRISLSEGEMLQTIKKLKTIINNKRNNVSYSRIILFEILVKFLGEKEMEENIPKWFEDMCEQMKRKENFVGGMESIIRISGKSKEYVSRCMRKYINMTVTEFVNDIRLSYATSALINTNLSITEIAYESGFYSVSWFNKIFLEKYGLTPREMRKKGRIL